MTTDKQNNDGQSGARQYDAPTDEVSIGELVLDIGRQWKIVVGVAVFCVAAAFLYTYLEPEVYRYTLNIEIGQSPGGDPPENANSNAPPPAGLEPFAFESPNIVMAEVQSALEVLAVEKDITFPLEFEVSNPAKPNREQSLMVRINAIAPKEQEKQVYSILNRAGADIVSQHADFLDGLRYKRERQTSYLEKRQENLGTRVSGYEDRIQNLQDAISRSRPEALAAAVELNILMQEYNRVLQDKAEIDDVLQELIEEVAVLESAVETFRAPEIDEELLDRQRRTAAEVQALLSVQPTRVLSLPRRAARPDVSVDPKLLILLGLVLGTGAGMVLALLVQAAVRVRG